MNRRDFLQPRHLASTTGQVLGALEEFTTLPSTSAAEVTLLHLGRRAMATLFELVLPYGTPAVALAESAFERLDQLEGQLTVYRETSEVSRLNRLAPAVAVPVEPGLFGLLETAARLSRETGGAFDITAGVLTKLWGFFRGPRRVPSEQERTEALTRVGMEQVVLEPGARTVRFLRPGVEINLGSIGKGYALDRVAEMLRNDWQVRSALLHGGFSSVHAIGSQPGEVRGWPVALRHPWNPAQRLGMVRLRNRALATSAATFKHLEYKGKKLGHILDPRTGWPAEQVASATVTAPTAAEADALSTAFFVLGIEAARQYCQRRPEIGAILLPEGEARHPVILGAARGECTLTTPLVARPGFKGFNDR